MYSYRNKRPNFWRYGKKSLSEYLDKKYPHIKTLFDWLHDIKEFYQVNSVSVGD